ncbi:hypothetical protein HNO92_003252 [Chromobacterium alkanivorans]|uniref:hypothetical protein n=1 Tax=Chromobacterium alkanivorans TaxID=1071719 RepID=UPI00216704E6|nr:hypothetical protein [Chromobacterium alkanivorans]MCS3805824.1 hypothetical protein [Chromobacterium alkanivorans]MCS3820163.1 hypothetical protein [Chromobacterium alkanivorans]MCS3874920.1 hypothetical protein [Chromobacterium alkanivorans]
MLYDNTLTFLQRLQMAATHGLYHYTSGDIDLERYDRMAKKFAATYGTQLSRQTKQKRRRAGEASASLFAVRRSTIPDSEGKIPVYWVLIASPGIGRIHEREKLLDLRNRDARLTAADGKYELVHDGKTWSWQLSSAAYRQYQQKIHNIATLPARRRQEIEIDGIRRDKQAELLLDKLYTEPGFRLLRRQVGLLVKEMRGEWERLRPGNGPRLSKRSFLPYIRFLPDKPRRAVPPTPSITAEERRALFEKAFPGFNAEEAK